MPICGRCQIEKDRNEFPKNRARPGGINRYCFPCQRLHNREMYAKHRNQYLARSVKYKTENPEKYAERLRQKRLTAEQWHEKRKKNKTTDLTGYRRQYQRSKALERDIQRIRQGGLSVKPPRHSRCPIFSSRFAGCKPCTKCGVIKRLSDFPYAKNRFMNAASACKPCKLEQTKRWRENNQEKLNIQRRQRYAARPDVRAKSLMRTKATKARRRSRMKDIRCDLTAQQWRDIQAIYGHRCAYCGQRKPLTQDHVVPIAAGGDHTASNIVPACRSCNSQKGARLPLNTFQPHLLQ